MGIHRIQQCQDSHLHWLATGRQRHQLDLRQMQGPRDFPLITKPQLYMRGPWLMGFGWDHNRWSKAEYPSYLDIDSQFCESPACFVRADGHAVWVNQKALDYIADTFRAPEQSRAVYWDQALDPHDGKILRLADGHPSGVFIDAAKEKWVDALLPEISTPQLWQGLLTGCQVLNVAGFTHVRDMTCNEAQWQAATQLEEQGNLTLYVREYFDAEDPADFEKVLTLAVHARRHQTAHLKLGGVKTYLDGALGSEGAFLSADYCTTPGSRGFTLMDRQRLCEVMRLSFAEDMPLALHVIGDAAADWAVEAYRKVTTDHNLRGELHLEHVQMLHPDTLKKMSDLKVICHMQPCHWLSDRHWLQKKLGPLFSSVFPWAGLHKHGVRFDFGSDTPIAPPSLQNNLLAIADLQRAGIAAPLGDPLVFHEGPNLNPQAPACYTLFAAGKVHQVHFDGRPLLEENHLI